MKYMLKSGVDLKAMRLYVIAKHHFSYKSGIFSLDELVDLLHAYGYRSLHNKTGNKRAAMKNRLQTMLIDSGLFRKAPDGRFIHSWQVSNE